IVRLGEMVGNQIDRIVGRPRCKNRIGDRPMEFVAAPRQECAVRDVAHRYVLERVVGTSGGRAHDDFDVLKLLQGGFDLGSRPRGYVAQDLSVEVTTNNTRDLQQRSCGVVKSVEAGEESLCQCGRKTARG